jgi:hypothetical protein
MNLGSKVLVDEYRTVMPATSLENSLDGNADLPLTSGKEGGCAIGNDRLLLLSRRKTCKERIHDSFFFFVNGFLKVDSLLS